MTLRFASLAAALCILAPQAHATQSYPDKPVRIIVPWTPGQATDVAARAAGEKLAAALGQPFIVENRAGAGGTIGATAVAKSEADGYTLLAGSSGSVTVNPLLMKKRLLAVDLEPAGLVAKVPYVLVTSSSFPAKSAQELIDLLRKSPESTRSPRRATDPSDTSPRKSSWTARASRPSTFRTRAAPRRLPMS